MTVYVGSRVVVVEPHADDAFLSLGSTLERWRARGVQVDIVTVFCNSRRATEAANYAAAIGADHVSLGYPESGCGLTGPPPVRLPVTPDKLRELVRIVAGRGVQVVWPLGLRHPEHRVVGAAALLDRPTGFAYVETPYQLVKRNAAELEMLAGLYHGKLQAEPKDPAVWRHIPLFRSQSFFFHRNPPSRLGSALEVLLA